MKKIIILFVFTLILSCSNDDDNNSIITSDGLIELELTKTFLVNEKWFLHSAIAKEPIDINGDGNATKDLMSQFPTCDLDSFYQFERIQEDRIVLIDDGVICEDFDDRYFDIVYPFNIDVDEEKLNIDLRTSQLLGGIENIEGFNDIDGFYNVKFLISPDSEFKIIRGTVQNIPNEEDIVNVTYELRADFDNRPDITFEE